MSVSSAVVASANRSSLDHLRWLAALAVVVQHARGLVMVDYTPGAGIFADLILFVTGFSHQAVVIFFVLSGHLVGGKAWRMIAQGSSPASRRGFVIDRASRILIVLWPAVMLSALVAIVAPLSPVLTTAGWSADLPDIRATATPGSWAVTIVLLNELLVPTTPFDGPLWSLAYEWTYYVVAAAALCWAARDRGPLGIVTAVYALVLLVLAAWRLPLLLWMMGFWLIGAVSARVKHWRHPVISGAVFFGVLLASRFGLPASLKDAVLAAATALLIADTGFRGARVAPGLAATSAGFSYSLYAIHWPVMLLFVAYAQRFGLVLQRMPAGVAAYGAILLLSVVACLAAALFADLTERRTDAIRVWFTQALTRRRLHPGDLPQR